MTEQTVSCPICGEPYVFYAYKVGDQSACPECRQKVRSNEWVPYPKEPPGKKPF
ncbi:hypothetical protein LCGC14_1511770 [marine sediment metagenome]|uniref:Uncharacterized protein n=1 Tax=marine sediment metagenome TaxID=412755 RepID=A0A0F9LGP2_9ZZZZ